ncbi:hypothetical protein ScPMuIL_010319 [Solemya velum]
MASQSTGIQQLLAAEKKAAEKVAEARKRKAKRLKQAKEEAQADIEKYRGERETQYKRYEESVLGSRGDMEARIAESTKQKIHEISDNVHTNKELALKKLLDIMFEIKPELHETYNCKCRTHRESSHQCLVSEPTRASSIQIIIFTIYM